MVSWTFDRITINHLAEQELKHEKLNYKYVFTVYYQSVTKETYNICKFGSHLFCNIVFEDLD